MERTTERQVIVVLISKEDDMRAKEKREATFKKLRDEHEAGNVVFVGIDSILSSNLSDWIKQPAAGMLYDLNRTPEGTATMYVATGDIKYINDFAVYVAITKLKNELESVNPFEFIKRVIERKILKRRFV